MTTFERLLSPGFIGGLEVRNRMIATALVTEYADERGMPTEQYVRYHEEKARGGWGLVITEDYAILPDGRTHERLPGLWSDSQVASHAEFVRRVHDAGGTIGVQLFHPGRATSKELAEGNLIAPSALRDATMKDMPHEMDEADIHRVIEAFALAAARAKKCGFDLVEVHGAHGYLINQFLSGFSNKRCDRYGGTLENRMRFALEVVSAVREVVGPGYPLSFRMSVDDYAAGGVTPSQARILARKLEAAGIDLINCSRGVPVSKRVTTPPSYVPAAYWAQETRAIKDAVGIPVAAVGRISNPIVAEDVLASGCADFVAMGRESLADPFFPEKIAQGRHEDVIECIACLRGCAGELRRGHPVHCVLNPRTGREAQYDDAARDDADSQYVLVIGGGIAGMQAALTADSRGHIVELVERDASLGGQWKLAAVPPGKECLSSFVSWQRRQLEKSRVNVRLGIEATAQTVLEKNPDAVIVATGSVPLIPPIAGLRDSSRAVDAHSVLAGAAFVSGRVAVLGGGSVGAETAAFLAEQGCEVAIVEMAAAIAAGEEPLPREHLLELLHGHGVILRTGATVVGVEDGNVTIEADGRREVLPGFDAIVTAFGALCDTELARRIRGTNYAGRVIVVGDALVVADGYEAVRVAHEAALGI